MKKISSKIRKEAVKEYRTLGVSLRTVADKYGVSAESVRRWCGFRSRPKGTKYSSAPVNQTSLFEQNVSEKRSPFRKNVTLPNSNRPWSKTEDDILKDAVLDKLTTLETAKILGRSVPSVWSRKCILTRKGFIQGEIRFSPTKGIKRPRRSKMEKVIASNPAPVQAPAPVAVKTPTRSVDINQIELSDLAAMVKSYGVSVTVMVTENGKEVKIHN